MPTAELANRVAEINPTTGGVVGEFSLLPSFDVNYGDLNVCQCSGHLFRPGLERPVGLQTTRLRPPWPSRHEEARSLRQLLRIDK